MAQDTLEKQIARQQSGTLSFEEFQNKYNSRQLGKLYLPNGACYEDNSLEPLIHDRKNFLRIDLMSLYDLIVGRKDEDFSLNSEDFIGLIVHGSSVKFPGYTFTKNKNHGFLSSIIHYSDDSVDKKIPLTPSYARFTVIVYDKVMRHSAEGGDLILTLNNHKYAPPERFLVNGRIKINYVCLDDIKYRLQKESDFAKIFERGIPLLHRNGRLDKIYSDNNIDSTNPRKIEWYYDKNILSCKIE